MTTISLLPPPLERLFDRLDAAEPSDVYLRGLLEIWRTRRLSRLLPQPDEIAGAVPDQFAAHAFVFRHLKAPPREWELVEAGADAQAVFGPFDDGRTLSHLRSRRLAVRLRRLFDLVRETKEPVAASFGERARAGEPSRFEVLVAPLSSQASEVDAVCGGIVWR
jgi:hypothetical protein